MTNTLIMRNLGVAAAPSSIVLGGGNDTTTASLPCNRTERPARTSWAGPVGTQSAVHQPFFCSLTIGFAIRKQSTPTGMPQ